MIKMWSTRIQGLISIFVRRATAYQTEAAVLAAELEIYSPVASAKIPNSVLASSRAMGWMENTPTYLKM